MTSLFFDHETGGYESRCCTVVCVVSRGDPLYGRWCVVMTCLDPFWTFMFLSRIFATFMFWPCWVASLSVPLLLIISGSLPLPFACVGQLDFFGLPVFRSLLLDSLCLVFQVWTLKFEIFGFTPSTQRHCVCWSVGQSQLETISADTVWNKCPLAAI